MIKNKEKQFDCIKMKNRIQAQVYAETHNMSKEELLNYFNNNPQGCPFPGVLRQSRESSGVHSSNF